MSDLDAQIKFLTARVDEDEAVALAAGGHAWSWDHGFGAMCDDKDCPYGHLMATAGGVLPTILMEVHGFDVHRSWQGGPHIARWDPSRVLAGVWAKRRIIDRCLAVADRELADVGEAAHDLAFGVLDVLTQEYSGHADFDPEWSLS